jgi:hypothetical protein
MNLLTDAEQTAGAPTQNTVATFKEMIAKAILYKAVHKASHKMFKQATGNVVAYAVSVISRLIGDRLDFDVVWRNQDVSPQFKLQAAIWLREVGDALFSSADGKMISEWAKKPECWETIKSKHYSAPSKSLPETRTV